MQRKIMLGVDCFSEGYWLGLDIVHNEVAMFD